MLGSVLFTPLFGAVLICWMFSVCVHEYAHALVAYWGGDRSVRERGYLSFNFFSYLHPVTSFLIPALFLAMGGLPLPGGAVLIDHRALRSKHWSALVSAAGPLANLLLFFVLAFFLHPSVGLVDPTVRQQPPWATLLGAVACLELISVFFNLLPLPPLDGYGMLRPYLPLEIVILMRRISWGGLVVVYLLFSHDGFRDAFFTLPDYLFDWLGLPFDVTWRSYNIALFGSSQ